MPKLRVLRLFGNPLEFLPEILPLHNLRHLTLANIRIDALESLKSVTVEIEVDKLFWNSIILPASSSHYLHSFLTSLPLGFVSRLRIIPTSLRPDTNLVPSFRLFFGSLPVITLCWPLRWPK